MSTTGSSRRRGSASVRSARVTSTPLSPGICQSRSRSAGRVVAQGIVVGEGQALGAGREGIVHRPLGGRVAPACLLRILIKAVLRVVDDEVRAREELDVTAILRMHGRNADPREGPSGR